MNAAHEEQVQQLERVKQCLGRIVLQFCRQQRPQDAHSYPRFRAADLHVYVAARAVPAPDSPSRILRALRRAGLIGYRVVSRSQSLYELTYVNRWGR